MCRAELSRYIVNGLFATGVHYSVLVFNMQVYEMESAGFANLVAAIFGIAASFLGNRYYVFKVDHKSVANQAVAFAVLYVSIAVIHGAVLYGWTDVNGFDYRVGFIIATFVQFVLSYLGNKLVVFRE